MYMSYCRFEGTRNELRTCLNVVTDCVNEDNEYPVSDHEIQEFTNMVEDIVSFLQELELLDEDGELNYGALHSICNSMRRAVHPDPEEPDDE